MEYTPTSKGRIVSALRKLWLWSSERSTALRNANYSCSECGVKQSVAKGKEQKVQVHHKDGIGSWDRVIEVIRAEILCSPDKLEVLCPECHAKKR